MAKILMVVGVWIISSAIAKIMLVTGLSVFSYKLVGGFVDDARAQVIANYNNLPADVVAIISLTGISEGLSILLSALSIAGGIKMAKVFFGIGDN